MVKDNRAQRARAALFARLRRERVVNAGRWTRDVLQNRGTLSETKRKDFSELSDGEVSSIEAAVREISG
jgi:hypothetical protein